MKQHQKNGCTKAFPCQMCHLSRVARDGSSHQNTQHSTITELSTIVVLFNSDIQYHRQISNYRHEMAFNNSHFSMRIHFLPISKIKHLMIKVMT